jgi:hypothetical protein
MVVMTRNETPHERLDRLWVDQLQELRVMQTGVQLLAGFLLTLPFQPAFDDLDGVQIAMFLGLMATAVLTTLSVMTAISVHRRLTGRHVKDRVVAAGAVALRFALGGVALLVVGMLAFMVDVVVGRTPAQVVAVVMGMLAVGLLVALPRLLSRDL